LGAFGTLEIPGKAAAGRAQMSLTGQKPKFRLMKCLPVGGHSSHAASAD
jgi:hypothetical protein